MLKLPCLYICIFNNLVHTACRDSCSGTKYPTPTFPVRPVQRIILPPGVWKDLLRAIQCYDTAAPGPMRRSVVPVPLARWQHPTFQRNDRPFWGSNPAPTHVSLTRSQLRYQGDKPMNGQSLTYHRILVVSDISTCINL